MTLHLQRFAVESITEADRTHLDGTTLAVDVDGLKTLVLDDPRIADVGLSIVHPGEETRIVRVLDVLEPRAKPSERTQTFPGLVDRPDECGSGVTESLSGMAIIASGSLDGGDETFIQEDCVIDMFGHGARLTPFGWTANLVVHYELEPTRDTLEAARAVTEADVRIARYLAGCTKDANPIETRHVPHREEISIDEAHPQVVYVCSLISEGFLHDTLLYGESTETLDPRWVDPVEFLDGALVSSDYHYACQRTPTYLYQNNPVLDALLERDGEGLDFLGAVVSLRYGTDDRKLDAARRITAMCVERGATGLIVHPAVGGNAQLDALYVVQEATRAGIATSMMVQEMAGPLGEDLGLVDFVPEADLLLSTGNRDEVIELPEATRLVGGDTLLTGGDASGPLETPMRLVCCSTSQVGALPTRAVSV